MFLIVIPLLLVANVYGQNTTGRDTFPTPSTEFALRVHYGVIYAPSYFVQNTAGAHPRGAEFEVSKQLADKINWDNYRCYPRMGLVFSYFNFNTPILGKSYSASYFLEPNFRLSSHSSFFSRGSVGLSYLTNPHDSLKNPANQSYSLPVNFFLALGVGINYRLNSHFALGFMASFQHNSNGDFSLPNHGVNFPTASLGIKYNVYNNRLPVYQKIKTYTRRNAKPVFEAGVYYSPKSGYKPLVYNRWVSQRKYVFGTYLQAGKQVSSLDAVTAMVEVYKDGALGSIKKNLGDSSSNILAGLMVGHEFIFRHIIFSQQIGAYLYKNTSSFTGPAYMGVFPTVYHRWGLRYRLNAHFYAGFNLLVHNQVADFIDVRMSYRFW